MEIQMPRSVERVVNADTRMYHEIANQGLKKFHALMEQSKTQANLDHDVEQESLWLIAGKNGVPSALDRINLSRLPKAAHRINTGGNIHQVDLAQVSSIGNLPINLQEFAEGIAKSAVKLKDENRKLSNLTDDVRRPSLYVGEDPDSAFELYLFHSQPDIYSQLTHFDTREEAVKSVRESYIQYLRDLSL